MKYASCLTWYRVRERISLITARCTIYLMNGRVGERRRNEAIGFCSPTSMQGDYDDTVTSESDIQGMPGTDAKELILGAHLSELRCVQFIDEDETHGLMRIILCSIHTNGFPLHLNRDQIVLQMGIHLHDTEHCRLL